MTEPTYPPPGDQPQYGQPGQQPQFGQPAQPPQYGQPGQPPQYGQPGQPAQHGDQPQYGQYGQPQYGSDQVQQGGYYTPAPVTRPPAIDKAVLLMKIGAGLSLVAGLLGLTQGDAIREATRKSLEEAGVSFTPADLDRAVQFGTIGGVVTAVIFAGLWWLMAVMNAKGRSWARILSTIFFGLSLLSFVWGMSQPAGREPLNLILSVLEVLVGAAAVWFMWQKESSAYYEAASRTP
jgi:hypothetical protein